jgi:type IV pilus secretin PilQ/predicted competence protein
MVYPKHGWLGLVIQSAITTFVVAIVAVGCASPPEPSSAVVDEMMQTLGDVTVTRDGDDSIVVLEGLVDPIYSVSTPDDSNLVVVDLVGVSRAGAGEEMELGEGSDQIAAYDGVVDVVTFATYEEEGDTPLTRVEIAMASPGRAEVVSTATGLEIRVITDDGMAASTDEGDFAATEETDADRWGEETLPTIGDDDTLVSETTAEVAPPPAATTLTALSTRTTEDGVLVGLEADGAIGSLEAFTLTDPARLVVDLPGIAVAEGIGSTNLDSAVVKAIRLGVHDDKVRIVLDGGAEADDFEGRQIMPGTTGLWIAVGSGESLSQAMTDALDESEAAWLASAEAVGSQDDTAFETTQTDDASVEETSFAASESTIDETIDETEVDTPTSAFESAEPIADTAVIPDLELAEVYGLHYERADGMDRTAILSDEALEYRVSTPDETTVVVSLPNARISQEASDRIFPHAGGPISLIHAFQQPDVDVPEVRVVFTRAPNLTPVVSRRGSMLFVDFEDVGIAAAPPPAFPNAGMDDEGGTAPMTGDAMELTGTATTAAPMTNGTSDAMGATPSPAAAGDGSMPMEGSTTPIEVAVDGLPTFEQGGPGAAAPGAMEAPGSVWDAPVVEVNTDPAAVEVPAAIEVLEEGGLIDGKEYRGRRVSLDFKDVEIADVLRLIAEVSDLNIIAGDEVKGNVTIRLVEVPWDQALDVILMTKGLGFVRVGNVLRIAPADVLKAEEEVRLQERRNKEKLEDLEVKLLPVNYASVKDVEGLVKRLLSARGTVNLDERTNTLIIKDISSVIDESSALIAAIDTQTPQVMIEAKIVEANLDFSRELGAVWGIQTQQFVDPFDPQSGPRRDLGSEDLTFVDDNSLVFANPITAVPNGLATLGALILDQDFRIDAQIQAAESTGDGKVVSSPRIVTLDNKEAKIEQGVSIPFQTFEGGDAKLEFIDAVLSLIVTPHITADESIIMQIEVTRNAPDDSVDTPTGSPAIAKNVAETETLVKDGQTLVLGGIYTITKTQRSSRIPYLHRIPVIGNAFKNNSVTDARKELLVFVTPRIVRLPEMASN